jgi:hypothetical protein
MRHLEPSSASQHEQRELESTASEEKFLLFTSKEEPLFAAATAKNRKLKHWVECDLWSRLKM